MATSLQAVYTVHNGRQCASLIISVVTMPTVAEEEPRQLFTLKLDQVNTTWQPKDFPFFFSSSFLLLSRRTHSILLLGDSVCVSNQLFTSWVPPRFVEL